MKKVIKWISISTVAILFVGIILLVVGFKFGGKFNWYLDFDSKGDKTFAFADSPKRVEDNFSLEEFNTIIGDTVSVDLYVVEGDEYKVEYYTYDYHEPKIEVKNDKLSIKVPHNSVNASFNFEFDDPEYIKVTVPSDKKTYEVEIEGTSGETRFEQINVCGKIVLSSGAFKAEGSKAEGDLSVEMTSGECSVKSSEFINLNVSIASGNVNLEEIVADSLKLNETSGNLNLSGITLTEFANQGSSGELQIDSMTCDTFNHNATSGQLKINSLECKEFNSIISSGDVDAKDLKADKINSEATSGRTNFEIIGKAEDYGCNLHAVSGMIKFADSDAGNKLVSGENKDKQIKIDVTSGDIIIVFVEN